MANIPASSDSSFAADVLQSAEPVLVDFGAEWRSHSLSPAGPDRR